MLRGDARLRAPQCLAPGPACQHWRGRSPEGTWEMRSVSTPCTPEAAAPAPGGSARPGGHQDKRKLRATVVSSQPSAGGGGGLPVLAALLAELALCRGRRAWEWGEGVRGNPSHWSSGAFRAPFASWLPSLCRNPKCPSGPPSAQVPVPGAELGVPALMRQMWFC